MDDQPSNIESKTLTSTDVLEHRTVIKFCVQAGKSQIETKRFILFDAVGDGPHCSRTMVYKWHQRFKDGGTDIFTDERKGRPQEVDTGVTEAELKGLNTDRKVTVREIADD